MSVIPTYDSAFVGVPYMNEIPVNAWYGTYKMSPLILNFSYWLTISAAVTIGPIYVINMVCHWVTKSHYVDPWAG